MDLPRQMANERAGLEGPDDTSDAPAPAQVAEYHPKVFLEVLDHLRRIPDYQARVGSAGYKSQLDANYRSIRAVFLEALGQEPCLASFQRRAERLLADSLEALLGHRSLAWEHPFSGGRVALARLEAQMLTALEAADHSPTWEPSAVKPKRSLRAEDRKDDRPSQPNHAQRQAEQRKARAHALREEGRTIKEIAYELRCSKRTVYSDLSDRQ